MSDDEVEEHEAYVAVEFGDGTKLEVHVGLDLVNHLLFIACIVVVDLLWNPFPI